MVKARRGEPPKEKLTHDLAVQKWNVPDPISVTHHPNPPSNPVPTARRKKQQPKQTALKHGLMDNIQEARINRW